MVEIHLKEVGIYLQVFIFDSWLLFYSKLFRIGLSLIFDKTSPLAEPYLNLLKKPQPKLLNSEKIGLVPIERIYWTIKIKSRWSFTERHSQVATYIAVKWKLDVTKLQMSWGFINHCLYSLHNQEVQPKPSPSCARQCTWRWWKYKYFLCSKEFTLHSEFLSLDLPQLQWMWVFTTWESTINCGRTGILCESRVVRMINSACSGK